jgi:limonene-1,2-epoxide hydrolase
MERIDWVTMNDKRAGFHVVGVFDVDDHGKIASWRDY